MIKSPLLSLGVGLLLLPAVAQMGACGSTTSGAGGTGGAGGGGQCIQVSKACTEGGTVCCDGPCVHGACTQDGTTTGAASSGTGGSTASSTSGTGGSTASSGSGTGGAMPGDLCTNTGGTVGMADCCASASSFPDTCAIGACSCAPSSSHMISVCNCPTGKCYDASVGCK